MNDYDVAEFVWDYENSSHDFYESYDLDDEYVRESNNNYQELAYRHYA
jgi:hypothetical protein|tara:strand:- start:692 stop:835 length:144 start_codon:yes stop_codon:yes gene_type:complete